MAELTICKSTIDLVHGNRGRIIGSLNGNLELRLRHLKGLNAILAEYDQQIGAFATTHRHEKPV